MLCLIRICIFVLCFILSSQILFAQIYINEVSSANDSVITDSDGDFEDWIELYNAGNSAINLKDYYFIMYETKPKKWVFPEVFIQAKSTMLLFASKKDRKSVIDHWEVAVVASDTFAALPGIEEPDSNWREFNYEDSAWFSVPGPIGYGYPVSTLVSDTVPTIYLRKEFNIPDTSIFLTGFVFINYDDAFVAYLNDVEIARSNIGVFGDNPTYDATAYEIHGRNGGEIFFMDEVLINASLRQGKNAFSLQLHNIDTSSSTLYVEPYLALASKDTSILFYPFPSDENLHTNFNLDSRGHKLVLYNANDNKEDERIIEEMEVNHSRGKNPDGSSNWCLFNTPSPGFSNDSAICYQAYEDAPRFDLKAGFYQGQQSVQISTNNENVIRYTLDGSLPDSNDIKYTIPIIIDSNTIIRARTFSSINNLPSRAITNTYFINDSASLPVISLTADPIDLFDFWLGIYELGPNADTVVPYQGANFWQGVKKHCHVEYFDKNGNEGFELDAGLKIHGNFSKAWPQKSFRILANDDYDESWIDYQLFPDKNIKRFKNFNIRNAGIDYNTTHFRDGLMNRAVREKTNMLFMDHQFCLLFVNGTYWGVYGLRERIDENYIKQNTGVDPNNIDLLRFEGDILIGSNEAFLKMVSFIGNNDMTIASNYDSVEKMLDIKNFIDYFATETYYNNFDWVGKQYSNNIKYWRPTNPRGKWQYILWDTDLGFGLVGGNFASYATNLLETILDSTYTNVHSTMLRGLLNNPTFKNKFINRYADLMNTIFLPKTLVQLINTMREEASPEMERHFTRWGGQLNVFGTILARATDKPAWNSEVDSLVDWANNRIIYARDGIQTLFTLTKQVDVSLNVSPIRAGRIKISTIIPDSLPWTGVYYDGVPVTLTVLPNEGYKFSHWKSDVLLVNPDSNVTMTLNISSDDEFTAYFEIEDYFIDAYPNPFSDEVTINYELPVSSQVSIELFALTGKRIGILADYASYQSRGLHTIKFNMKDYQLLNGVYFINFKTPEFNDVVKLIRVGK